MYRVPYEAKLVLPLVSCLDAGGGGRGGRGGGRGGGGGFGGGGGGGFGGGNDSEDTPKYVRLTFVGFIYY